MATFEYRAMQGNGAVSEGRLEASGRQDAVRILEGRGLTPVKLVETGNGAPAARSAAKAPAAAPGTPGKWSWQSSKVTFTALEDFTRSLASLLA
ncbi:MAG: hypothetical protein V4710_09330, partial [Verrucomicrobiota bacterium]